MVFLSSCSVCIHCLIVLATQMIHFGNFASTSGKAETTIPVSSGRTEHLSTTTTQNLSDIYSVTPSTTSTRIPDSSSTISSSEVSTASPDTSTSSSTASLSTLSPLSSLTTTEVIINKTHSTYSLTSTTPTPGCTCGISRIEDDNIVMRIIGGSLTAPHAYPWQAQLRYYQKHICSATVINDRYILTAAHCIFMMKDFQRKIEVKYGSRLHHRTKGRIDLQKMSVVLGAHDTADLTNTEVFSVESFLIHPDHRVDDVHDTNDLAVVKLSRRIQYTSQIQPVCLPDQAEDFSNQMGVIVGWGQTAMNGPRSYYLKHAKVHILADTICLRSTVGAHFAESPQSMICAYEYKNDACKGDSGGPLLYIDTSGVYIQAGIVSWGIGCARVGFPGVYTEVSTYTDWIKSNTKDGHYCSKP